MNQEQLTKYNFSLILLITLLTALIVGIGIYLWQKSYNKKLQTQNQQLQQENKELQDKINELQNQITQSQTHSKQEKSPQLSNTAECKKSKAIKQIITGPFRSIDGSIFAGEATLSGYVITRNIKYFGKEIKRVYLKISPQKKNTPQGNFYSYFIHMVEEGNTVNLKEDNNLLFGLGELTNGNTLSSTADISPLAKARILSAIKTGNIISLRIQVPIWKGMGAPSNFSFACAIESVEK